VAIYEPSLNLSKKERDAISVLNVLLTRSASGDTSANSSEELIEISPSEALAVADFLNDLRNSRKFMEGAYFTEALAHGRGLTDKRAKEIYLSWRSRLGKSRVASTFVWNEFVVRSGFGFSDSAHMYVRALRSPVRPMMPEHFLAMEIRLGRAYQLSRPAIRVISEFYEKRLRLIEDVRKGVLPFENNSIERTATDLEETFEGVARCSPKKRLTKSRLAACTGLIMDIGAIFITRDWTAAGVASVVGTTFPDLVGIE
jgi:hypothetical protein